MSARTTRTRLLAATTVALAAFALTACEGGSDTNTERPPSSATATAPAAPSTGTSTGTDDSSGGNGSTGSGSTTDDTGNGAAGSSGKGTPAAASGTPGSAHSTGSSGASGSRGSAGSAGADDSSPLPGKCSAATVKITASVVSRPINHLLLTATNDGSKPCVLPAYPMARFGEAQAVPPVAEETKPQAVTTLEAGASGYAGVLLSAGDGSASGGHTVHRLTVPFDDGSVATVALPSGGVYVDDALTVTYWQSSVDTALEY